MVLDELRKVIIEMLADGYDIRIRNLGTLFSKYKGETRIKNKLPKNGDDPEFFDVPPRIRVKFRQYEDTGSVLLKLSSAYFGDNNGKSS